MFVSVCSPVGPSVKILSLNMLHIADSCFCQEFGVCQIANGTVTFSSSAAKDKIPSAVHWPWIN